MIEITLDQPDQNPGTLTFRKPNDTVEYQFVPRDGEARGWQVLTCLRTTGGLIPDLRPMHVLMDTVFREYEHQGGHNCVNARDFNAEVIRIVNEL